MSENGYFSGGQRRGKSQWLEMARDAALKQGQTVAVANLVDGKVHFCIVKPFRRPKDKPLLNWPK